MAWRCWRLWGGGGNKSPSPCPKPIPPKPLPLAARSAAHPSPYGGEWNAFLILSLSISSFLERGAKAIEFFILHSSLFTLHFSLFTLPILRHQPFSLLQNDNWILHSSLFTLHSSLFILHSSFFILPSSLPKASAFFTFLPFYFFTFKTSSVSHFFIIFARIIKTMRV